MRCSVIIPTYNRATLVGRAITSALAQTLPPCEVIVVDDGSTDDTPAVLERFGQRITVLRQPNAGVSAARNAALRHCTGEFVAFLDSDDVWEDWKLAAQAECFRRCPDLVILGTDAVTVFPDGSSTPGFLRSYLPFRLVDVAARLPTRLELRLRGADGPELAGTAHIGDLASLLFLGNMLVTPTVCLRRDVLARAGIFDAAMQDAGEDYDLFWRVAEHGPGGFIDLPAVRVGRGMSDQLHASGPRMALSNLRSMRRYLAAHPRGPDLPASLIRQRWRISHHWAARALFDAGRRAEARVHAWQAIRHGDRSPRMPAYLLLSWLPPAAIRAAQRAWQFGKPQRKTPAGARGLL